MLQRDLHLVAVTFPDVYAEVPASGQRFAWDGDTMLEPGPQALGLDVDLGDGISKVQLLIAQTDGEDWVFHRGRRTIRRLLRSIGRNTADFIMLEPLLSDDERGWLRERIRGWRPNHPWLNLFTAAALD